MTKECLLDASYFGEQSYMKDFQKQIEKNTKPRIPNLVRESFVKYLRLRLNKKEALLGTKFQWSGMNHINCSKFIYLSLQSAMEPVQSSSIESVPQPHHKDIQKTMMMMGLIGNVVFLLT